MDNKFADDELKRLKAQNPWGLKDTLTWDKFQALISRLESAERVCEASSEKIGLHNQYCNARHKCALPRVGEMLVAWLRSKGEKA